MKLKTLAIATMAVTLTGTSAIAITQIVTAERAEAGERSTLHRAGYSERRGHKGARRAGGERAMMRTMFRDADTDNDNALTQGEIDTYIASTLEVTDADGDGRVTLDEFQVTFEDMTRNRMVDAFQRLDEDGSGTITAEELNDRFGNVVARMDRNEDGVVSHADRRGKRGERRGGPRGRAGRDMMRQIARDADTDGDNALSQAELDAYIAGQLQAADASGDGQLSLEEFNTIYRALMRNRMVDAFQRFDDDGDGAITAQELDERFGDVVVRLDRNEDGKLSRADRRGRDRHRGDRR